MNDEATDFVGPASWVRVDFHLHSPAVDSFTLPSGTNLEDDTDRERIADLWVERLVAAEVGLGALTDYNHIDLEWYELLESRAREQGIVLLPGAELSLAIGRNVAHVLLVCDRTDEPQKINEAIRAIDHEGTAFVTDRVHRELDLGGTVSLATLMGPDVCHELGATSGCGPAA